MTQLTPAGAAGVAVLRVTGTAAIERLRAAFSGTLPARGQIAYGVLESASAETGVLDEVLVVRAAGEHAAFELHVHGSPFVVGEITRRLDPDGPPRPASGGGLSPLAVPFGDRALALVPGVPSVDGARVLLDQAAGAMGRALAEVRALPGSERPARLARLAQLGRERERLFRETTVALVGQVNAGKSTLFNVLVGADAASVSSEAGTTRDALSERARLGPWPVRFLDTAGERDLSAAAAQGDARALVEQQGQRIAEDLARRADLILRLVTCSEATQERLPGPETPRQGSPAEVVLVTQAARVHGPDPQDWPAGAISALEAPDHARRTVVAAFGRALRLTPSEKIWVAGMAVPFDERSVSVLETAAALSDVSDTMLDALAVQL